MALSFGGSGVSGQKSVSYMSQTKSKMDKSLLRISSGQRIINAGDDPGGLAVSMKLQNELTILGSARDRVENAKSFAEMQDTAISSAYDIVSELSDLKSKYATANADEKEAYESQFKELQVQLNDFLSEKVNGVSFWSVNKEK